MPLPRHLVLAALLVLATGCPGNPHGGTGDGGGGGGGGTDGGTVQTDGGGGGGADGGATDGGGSGGCTAGLGQCGAGKYCDATGTCVAGGACPQGTGNCDYPTGGAGCGGSVAGDCYCDPTDQTCKPRIGLCDPCTSDVQCGNDPNFYDPTAGCASYGGSKVCLVPVGVQACPRGYVPDTAGTWCVPNSGSCGTATVCNSDADCPTATPVCNKSSGTCVAACTFDLTTGDSSCPTGQVCDEDGHCRKPCDPNNDTCPSIDPSYICKQDTGGVYRCRIPGCLGDSECPVDPTTAYIAYCDLSTHQCVNDSCRTDKDCKSGNACDSTNHCVAMTCQQRGGTALSCAGYDEYCCNDPIPCTGSETPATDGSLAGCVMAPNPPWCQSCSQDSDCTYQSVHKDDPSDKDLCFSNKCANTCATNADCPRGFGCEYIETGCKQDSDCGTGGTCVDDGTFGKTCAQTSDCGSGSNVTCKTNPADGKMECFTSFKVCNCGGSGSPDNAACPSGARCAALAPSKDRCVQGKVCIDSPGTCK